MSAPALFLHIKSECVLILIKDANRARGLNLCRSCGPHFKTLSTQPLHKYLAVIVHTGHCLLGASSGAFEYFMDLARDYYYY